MTTIERNLQQVRERLKRACAQAGRDERAVALLAVSKTFDADAVCLALDAGQHAFGENYVQEGTEKIETLRRLRPDAALQWHCIGPLQSNKSRLVAEFESLGWLKEMTGNERNRLWCYQPYLELFHREALDATVAL